MKSQDTESYRICGSEEKRNHSLTNLLEQQGLHLNARCGQRGLCRGCMVELLEGTLIDALGKVIPAGSSVRSCQMRVPADSTVLVAAQPQARIGEAAQVSETFQTNTPCQLAPLYSPDQQRDTGFAIDLGTTTVVVLIADLTTGEVLSRAGDFSAQIRFGDNVISRIAAASSEETRTAMRQALVEETINPLVETACRRAGRGLERLAGGTIAGNTAMLHILAGVDPSSLGTAPFKPVFLEGRKIESSEIGLLPSIGASLPLQLLPGLAAYIGADISAGIHATGMALDPAPSLLVDMGTNGEVVLHKDGQLTGCATAAGPAFEGAGLSCGTRAQAGAVSRLELSLSPFRMSPQSISDTITEAGICGSAYIDFLAQARSCGLLGPSGRFVTERWQEIPEQQRIDVHEDGRILSLLSDARKPAISEVDIAHLLQAKAAIGAGIETLLHYCQISAGDIGQVHLAGGFGMHLNVEHAIAIGLLPEFQRQQVQVVGNTSLAGALLALLDRHALADMEALRKNIKVIELNEQPDFEDTYIDHLSLP